MSNRRDISFRLRSFLKELKRRRVYRVATVYAAAAFVVVEAADLLFPALNIPPWAYSLVVVLALLGFPIAIVLGWAFDVTPEGVRRAQTNAREPEDREEAATAVSGFKDRRALGILVLLVGIGFMTWAGFKLHGEVTSGDDVPEIRSLAVLPLDNLSGNADQVYFTDGMTDALTAELGRISGVTVISRTSATRYRDSDKPMPQIASELGVDALIEGSVLQAGDEVRITLNLVHGPTDRHLWARSYERNLWDVLALQRDVARAIAEEIEITLAPEEEALLASARPVDPEAYRLYLRGNLQLSRRGEEAYRRALDSYRQAVEIAPGYAGAWAGLAMSLIVQGAWFGSAPRSKILPEAREAIRRALTLDSTVAEAYVARGRIKQLFEWDWQGADQAFRRGIELNPSATYARLEYANFLTSMGRFEESIEVGRRTLEIDPLSPAAYNQLGLALWFAGRDDEALELYREGLQIEPDFEGSFLLLAALHIRRGELDRALAYLREFEERSDTESGSNLGWLGYSYSVAGRRDEALDILSRLMERRRTEPIAASALAIVFVGLEEHDEALRWLETAYEERDPTLVWLKVADFYDPLRSDPEFQSLLERMEFPKS